MEYPLTEAESTFFRDIEQHFQAVKKMSTAERRTLPEEHINLLVLAVVVEAVQILGREKGTLQVMEVVRSVKEEEKKARLDPGGGMGSRESHCVIK